MPELTQLGVGGIFAVLIIQMVLSFLKSKKPDVIKLPDSIEDALKAIAVQMDQMHEMKDGIKKSIDQTDKLYQMHDVRDLNGVPVWYVNQNLGSSIEKLADNINTQTVVMERIVEGLRNSENAHTRLEVKMDKLLRNTG